MPSNGHVPLGVLFVIGNLALMAGLLVSRERPSWRTSLPALYLLMQVAWALAQTVKETPLSLPFDLAGLAIIAEYATIAAPVMLLGATLAIVPSRRRVWLWLILPAAWAGAAFGLDARMFGPRNIELAVNGGLVTEDGLRLAMVWLAWAWACGLAIVHAWRTRLSLTSPLYRNRLRYWTMGLVLATAGAALLLPMSTPGAPPWVGGVATLFGSLWVVVTWRVYYLPDVRVMLRRTVSYIVITLVTFAVYLLGIRAVQIAFPMETVLEPLFGAVLVAGVLALVYAPLRQGVQQLTQYVLGGAAVDYATSLQDYSQRITQVLDLEPLAGMVLQTVNSALGISRGALLLVTDDPVLGLTLRPVGGLDGEALDKLDCLPTSPIARHWRAGGGPLLQYDIDVLPAYRLVGAAERAVLSCWKMEIFLPIRTMGQFIGVLALGHKRSGDPYFESDIAYLTALADETGVALQNARLFSELRDMNEQVTDVNRELEHANQQLQELDKLKSGFIGVITHELRSPFAALDFSLQLIQKYGLDHLLPEQREQLQQLAEGLKRAQTMINTLITFAAFLSKQGQLRMVTLDLGRLARETAKTLEPAARARNVKIILDVSGPLQVMGDRERLSEAIYHLVHNAIKFNREGGAVTLHCRAAPEDVIVEVSDTGIGIPPERLPEMWKDFAQLADPLRRGVEGLGLGLPLVRYVVRAHGGQVWARSQPGQGSVFGFRIPVAGCDT